jgi:hypothetical protein
MNAVKKLKQKILNSALKLNSIAFHVNPPNEPLQGITKGTTKLITSPGAIGGIRRFTDLMTENSLRLRKKATLKQRLNIFNAKNEAIKAQAELSRISRFL